MQLSNRLLELILVQRYRWVQHVLFWLTMYLPHLLALSGITGTRMPPKLLVVYVTVLVVDTALVYFNLYFQIPRFFLRRRYWQYALSTAFLVLMNAVLGSILLAHALSDGASWNPNILQVVDSAVLTFNLLMTAVGFNIIKRFLRNQARLKELETSGLKTELAYLKNQINPHFLFNALNSIYVSSRKNPAEVSESILHLSDLLRYQLYDCAQESVNLGDEIEYLHNYLQIDKMRKNKASVDFQVKGSPSGIKVAPFLFIPFVENALKHGLNLDNENHIRVFFDITPDEVVFEVENGKPELPLAANGHGGIGLTNIGRRLDLLYSGRYQLDIEDQERVYRVRLSLHPN